jgi:adenylosuccinate lyase
MKKSQPPKGISIKMFKKKTGGKRVNCFLYIVHRALEKMSKMFAKKVSKEGAKGHFAKIDPVFMRVPSKFRYFLATDWQHFLQYPLNKIIFL